MPIAENYLHIDNIVPQGTDRDSTFYPIKFILMKHASNKMIQKTNNSKSSTDYRTVVLINSQYVNLSQSSLLYAYAENQADDCIGNRLDTFDENQTSVCKLNNNWFFRISLCWIYA